MWDQIAILRDKLIQQALQDGCARALLSITLFAVEKAGLGTFVDQQFLDDHRGKNCLT